MPVSYTHLDVYKRQEYNWKKQYENMEANFNVSIKFEDSFSSTHLE